MDLIVAENNGDGIVSIILIEMFHFRLSLVTFARLKTHFFGVKYLQCTTKCSVITVFRYKIIIIRSAF